MLATAAPTALATLDGTVMEANEAWLRLTGREPGALGRLRDLVHPEDAPVVDDLVTGVVEGCEPSRRLTERRLVRPDDVVRWASHTLTALREGGSVTVLVHQLHDETASRTTAMALAARDDLLKALGTSAPLALLEFGPDGHATAVGARWTELTGQRVDDALGLGWMTVVAPEDRGYVLESGLRALERGASFDLRFQVVRSDGELRWLDLFGAPVGGPGARGAVATAFDVTAEVIGHELLGERRDPVTGLATRPVLADTIDAAVGGARHDDVLTVIAAVVEDLERHLAAGLPSGEVLARVLADRVRTRVRGRTDVPGRLDTGAFAVVCRRTPVAGAEVLARRLLVALAEPVDLHGELLVPTVRVGIAVNRPGETRDGQDLLSAAEAAARPAQRAGAPIPPPPV